MLCSCSSPTSPPREATKIDRPSSFWPVLLYGGGVYYLLVQFQVPKNERRYSKLRTTKMLLIDPIYLFLRSSEWQNLFLLNPIGSNKSDYYYRLEQFFTGCSKNVELSSCVRKWCFLIDFLEQPVKTLLEHR